MKGHWPLRNDYRGPGMHTHTVSVDLGGFPQSFPSQKVSVFPEGGTGGGGSARISRRSAAGSRNSYERVERAIRYNQHLQTHKVVYFRAVKDRE